MKGKLGLQVALEKVREYEMTRRLVRKIMIEYLRKNVAYIYEEGDRRKVRHYTSDLSDKRLADLVELVKSRGAE